MRRLAASVLLGAGLAAGLAFGAQAAVVSPRPDSVSLAIYHQGTVDTAELAQSGEYAARSEGLALVTESRGIDLPAGPVEIQFRGVAATMVPATADVSGLPGAVKDRNFDFDLLSPGSLIAKSIGAQVHLVRTNPKTGVETDEPATLASGPDGVVLKFADHVEALGCSGLPERLVFNAVPATLFDTPTLSVHATVPRAGHYNVTLRYIATGMNWSADYVARVAPDDRTLDLSGWITLANFSESGFSHVPVEVIAGQVATTGNDTPPDVPRVAKQQECWPTEINWATYHNERMVETVAVTGSLMRLAAPAPPAMAPETVLVTGTSIKPRNLGDYKLYPLNEPTDVNARQTKQVQFLDSHAVPFQRIYRVRVTGVPFFPGASLASDPGTLLASTVQLRLDNSKKGKLGEPLPAGGISVLTKTDGAPLLAGQDRIDDMAVGLPVEITTGQTMAVNATAVALDSRAMQQGKRIRRTQIEVRAANDKPVAATFEWHQAMDQPGMTLVSESRAHGRRNGDLVWAIALKPGARVTFRYTMDVPD